jgi:hypothetical protein
MSNWQTEAFGPLAPLRGKVEAIAVTATAQVLDLSTCTNIYADLQAGRLCMADADGNDIYFAFLSEATGAIDDTNTTRGAAEQCARLPTGCLVTFRPPIHTLKEQNSSGGAITSVGMCRYIALKCAAGKSATLRLLIVSEAPHKRVT